MQLFQDNKNQIVFTQFFSYAMKILIFASAFLLQVANGEFIGDQGTHCSWYIPQRKMLVLANGNKFKIDRQQHNSTSNFVSANFLIAKFMRYDVSSIGSHFVTLWAVLGIFGPEIV